MRIRFASMSLLLMSVLLVNVWAAPIGSVAGTIRDASGATVPNAHVVLTSIGTNERAESYSDPSGYFQFRLLTPGVYKLVAEANGFKRAIVESLVVEVDQVTHFDLGLEVGSTTEVLEVSAVQPLIQIEENSLSSVVDTRVVSSMPLNGRQFLDLVTLTPGTTPAAVGVQGGGFNVGGMRSQSNNFLIDGINNNDTQQNAALNNFRITDAVQEFAVQTSVYQAEFGHGMGGQVNVVTKSGSNDFHGSAFEYIRNTVLNAADFFANKNGTGRTVLNRNQFGGTAGGPIKHDKTFFFLSYEGFRQVAPAVSSTRVPTDAERATVTNPISLKILQFWPKPNVASPVGGINYIAGVRTVNNDDTGLAKIDHIFSDHDRLSGRWAKYQGNFSMPGATPLSGGDLGYPVSYSSNIAETHVFSAHVLNEFRFGFSRNRVQTQVPDQGFDAGTIFTDASGNPLAGVVNPSLNPLGSGLPNIKITGGFAQLGGFSSQPQGRTTTTYEIVDNVTMLAPFGSTKHSLRLGYHVRREEARRYNLGGIRGQFSFRNFADFASGLVNSATILNGNTVGHFRRYPWDFYLQDQYRITSQLVLNYGIRYEYPSTSVELNRQGSNFVPGAGLVLIGSNNLLVINPLKNGPSSFSYAQAPYTLPRSGVFFDRNNIAPVVGVAWSPNFLGKSGQTVFRAGIRSGYDDLFNNIPSNLTLSAPWTLSTTQTAGVTQPSKFPYAVGFSQNVPLVSNYGSQGPGTPTVGLLFSRAVDPNIRSAYSWNYNVGVQRMITRTVAIEATYVGTEGHKLGIYVDANQPHVIVVNPLALGSSAPNQQVFPYNTLGNMYVAKAIGNSDYNAAIITVKYRSTHGIFLQAAYTYGKSLDNNSAYFGSSGEAGTAADNTNLRVERGPSSFDVRHRLVATYLVDLPIGPGHRFLGWNSGLSREVFGGWQIAGITTFQSGTPFTVFAGFTDYSGFNQYWDRPNIVRPGALIQDNSNPLNAFDITDFSLPGPATVGTSGRNQYYGPGLINWDFSAIKSFHLFGSNEGKSLQFRADFFNLWNHTNFANPSASMDSSSFGLITQTLGAALSSSTGTLGGGTGGPRLVQLALRFQF